MRMPPFNAAPDRKRVGSGATGMAGGLRLPHRQTILVSGGGLAYF